MNNKEGGIVAYIRKGEQLPTHEFIRDYQNAIKRFCKKLNRSKINYESIFYGNPSITFCDEKTKRVVIFDRESKTFITTYILNTNQLTHYLETGEIANI